MKKALTSKDNLSLGVNAFGYDINVMNLQDTRKWCFKIIQSCGIIILWESSIF